MYPKNKKTEREREKRREEKKKKKSFFSHKKIFFKKLRVISECIWDRGVSCELVKFLWLIIKDLQQVRRRRQHWPNSVNNFVCVLFSRSHKFWFTAKFDRIFPNKDVLELSLCWVLSQRRHNCSQLFGSDATCVNNNSKGITDK